MRFEGRMSGESIGRTMPLLSGKGYRRVGRAVWLRTNTGDFTPQVLQFPAI